jgi:predicted MPP superfamily phosphohydrolase
MFAVIVLLLIVLVVDMSLYFKYIQLINKFNALSLRLFQFAYWFVPVFYLIFVYIMLSKGNVMHADQSRIYWVSGLFILIYIPKLIALFITVPEFLINGFGYILKQNTENKTMLILGRKLNRMEFLSQIGFLSGIIMFGSLSWGMIVGKTKYAITKLSLAFKTLPSAFDGFKIVQISDIHFGSWSQTEHSIHFFEKVVNEINNLQADLIVFTGDLVNNVAIEADFWVDIMAKLEAKHGKFSILGNHDYGTYTSWNSKEEHEQNMLHLYDLHKKMGFKLLRNQNETIYINNESIHVVGVENWGAPPFPQYGDYEIASKDINPNAFQILLSHDPSHWNEIIMNLEQNVALTLSGHTHGMQFAFNFNGKSYSPVQWKYKSWRGLYSHLDKKLYVNIGLGNIAYPGRVGTPPEISLFELKTKA